MAKEMDKCKCVPGMGIVALILGVIGLYSVILGVKTQLTSLLVYNNWIVMVYYAVGVLAISLAKICKHHAYGRCVVHKMN